MNILLSIFFITFVVFGRSRVQFQGTVVPKPFFQKTNQLNLFFIDPTTFDIINKDVKDSLIIKNAISRFTERAFPFQIISENSTLTTLKSLTVQVIDSSVPLEFKVDESYMINVTAGGIFIKANTTWGVLYGLETLSQLIIQDNSNKRYVIYETAIFDKPRFPHRGFMLDNPRKFINVNNILLFIDSLAYMKMNVLHFRLNDDQSFPYVSLLYPELYLNSSFEPHTHAYSPMDIKRVIHYGYERGVRIMFEFDIPGHSSSWRGIKELVTDCLDAQGKPTQYKAINPAINFTYNFFEKFFGEARELMERSFMHFGGDEVNFGCWANNPQIREFMVQKGFGTDYKKLQTYFFNRLHENIIQKWKNPVVWEEIYVDSAYTLNKDYIVNVWKWYSGSNLVANVVKNNRSAIVSYCWYMQDMGYNEDWTKYYRCDPHTNIISPDEQDRVIGGTACAWGTSEERLFYIAWDRTFTAAERLWSQRNVVDVHDASARFYEHYCRLVWRGIPARDFGVARYCPHEYKMAKLS